MHSSSNSFTLLIQRDSLLLLLRFCLFSINYACLCAGNALQGIERLPSRECSRPPSRLVGPQWKECRTMDVIESHDNRYYFLLEERAPRESETVNIA
ncbi:hypothetical protein CPB84DRAFT_1779077 [Gymnopilus junonius]|uniref:Uncharacterized protein n=1 Tax=Gymnopilus junonius TaxID=109634 RepID=A0A9P5NMT9_GYMJU|nr:hypothetical protein CPB84DRAFT_1779077 [Gymnopilus junonius]